MDRNTVEFWRSVQRHVNPQWFFKWFLGVNVPIAFLLSAFIAWHNSIVEVAETRHLVLRALVALLAFGIGWVIVWAKIFKPAIKLAKMAKSESKRSGQ
jgi:hypothetical protein